MASFLGALGGAFVYDTLIYTGNESLLNKVLAFLFYFIQL